MEKAEKIIAKRRSAPSADPDGPRKKPRVPERRAEVEDDEVEEFFAILRRMHGAVKYFEKAASDGRKWSPGTWRAALETGPELAVNGGPALKEETPVEELRKQRAGVVLDLNASPEESHGGD